MTKDLEYRKGVVDGINTRDKCFLMGNVYDRYY